MPSEFNATRAAFSLEGGFSMLLMEGILALARELPSFVDIIVRHALSILGTL